MGGTAVESGRLDVDLASVLRAAHVAARGKRRSPDVAAFLLDIECHALQLVRELRAGTWRPSAPRGFFIREPKLRLISALPFRDRVVQHLLIAATLPAIERSFAPQSYACRKGYGTHRCLRVAAELMRRHRYVLRLDVAKFFPSVDHAVVRRLLHPRTPSPWWPVTERIIDAPAHVEPTRFYFPGDDLFAPLTRPHGLPIGNLCSQIWANLVLTPVDHLLASPLGLGTFVRYCDDLLVFDDDAGRLIAAWEAVVRRCETLRLRLHPTKCRLHRTSERVAFVGFVLQRRGDAVRVALKTENVRRFRRRMGTLQALYVVGAVDIDEVASRIRAWLAHARHGHTRALCERVLGELAFSHSFEP
ncbi:MAG: reverse transcriptase domain-containing protein [Proteobacteria bacterium]|nr:reverse transcriptase domain-containing protein [Pseudomonadota bacterium]